MDDSVLNDYFEWLYSSINQKKRGKSYRKLFSLLHTMTFRYDMINDENRASDGDRLRWYYSLDSGYSDILDWDEECTVLEMLVGLAGKMNGIMENPIDGNSTPRWFWMFMDNLDILGESDKSFDKTYVMERVNAFMDRRYSPNGEGNIIYIEECDEDLRDVEIWYQMCWYLNSITNE